jgi:RNA polymerase sigma-70 factor (ECF subfamily)
MCNTKEKELLKSALGGDVSAFEELILPWQKKIYNITLNYTKNHDDALEISQEVLIKAFKNIKNFKGESSFSTWLFRIASNSCIDYYRKNSKISYIYVDEEIDNGENSKIKFEIKTSDNEPSKAYLQKELRESIKIALNKIPVELKTVVTLRDIHGFNYEEIASIVNIPLGTVKSRINRARLLLKEILLKDV